MKRYVLKRLIQSIVVMFIMSICSFALINAAPGEPAAAIYGGQMDKLTQAEKDRINENLGLDQPVIIRYGNWLAEVSHGNFGYSYANGQNVGKMIKERMPNTMTLFLSSFVLTVILSIAVGLFAGLHPDSMIDRVITIISITLNGIPSVLVGIILILLFSVVLGWLPSSGVTSMFSDTLKDRIIHLILPTVTVMFSHIGSFSRFIQEGLKEELDSYYVYVARANHMSKWDIYRGAMKNALVPFVNYVGTHVPSFFSGFVVIETVFAYPGLGNMIVNAIPVKDYPVLMGGILVTGIVVIISMLLVDLIDLALNPKLRKAVTR